MLLSAIVPKLHEKACQLPINHMTLEEQWPRSLSKLRLKNKAEI